MEIRFNNRDPVYVQVVRHFKQQIATGLLEPGQSVPSRRELAQRLKINPNTVQRAYKEMEEQGLIQTDSNQPSRVTTDRSTLQSVRDELMAEAVSQFVSAMRSINATVDEAVERIRSCYFAESGKEDQDD